MTIESGQVFAERYTLEHQVESDKSGFTWRAFDQSLNRAVCLFLLPVTDPRSTILTTNCEATGGIDSRGIVSMYDVIHAAPLAKLVSDGNPNQYFTGVVTEWVVGQSFQDLLDHDDESMQTLDALKMCKSIAETLAHVHSHGITHSMLTPRNIIFADSNEIRLLGLGIDKSMEHDYLPESVDDDVRALGLILFAALTHTTWTNPPRGYAVGSQKNALLRPSDYVSGIPAAVDDFFESTQNRGFTSMNELASNLDQLINHFERSSENSPTPLTSQSSHSTYPTQPKQVSRKRTILISMLIVLAMGWSGWKLVTMNLHRNGIPMALLPTSLWTASPTPTPSISKTPVHYELATITSIRDYDPLGSGEENSDQVSNAIDNDFATSWNTVQYRQDNVSGKAGVGLLIDLGSRQKIKAVATYFVDPGENLEIYVTDDDNPDVKSLTPFGSANDTDLDNVITSPKGQVGRYVLVWLTYLPKIANGSYQAGITEVQVRL